MTQSRRTADHLIPAVVSAATGVLFGPVDQVFAVITDISDGTIPPEAVGEAHERIRTELVRQFPWLAELQLPDFDEIDGETRAVKQKIICDLSAEHGGTLAVECGTLQGLRGLPGLIGRGPRTLPGRIVRR